MAWLADPQLPCAPTAQSNASPPALAAINVPSTHHRRRSHHRGPHSLTKRLTESGTLSCGASSAPFSASSSCTWSRLTPLDPVLLRPRTGLLVDAVKEATVVRAPGGAWWPVLPVRDPATRGGKGVAGVDELSGPEYG